MKHIKVHIKDVNLETDVRDGETHLYFLGRVLLNGLGILEVMPLNTVGFITLFTIPFLMGVIVGALAATLG